MVLRQSPRPKMIFASVTFAIMYAQHAVSISTEQFRVTDFHAVHAQDTSRAVSTSDRGIYGT